MRPCLGRKVPVPVQITSSDRSFPLTVQWAVKDQPLVKTLGLEPTGELSENSTLGSGAAFTTCALSCSLLPKLGAAEVLLMELGWLASVANEFCVLSLLPVL